MSHGSATRGRLNTLPDPADNLPGWLSERTRIVKPHATQKLRLPATNEFVLYWTHHAVRDDHNPALDVARLMADRLRLPLLVYQGLHGNHRFNNDRHHTFILEGARDLQQALRRRGISYAFSLDRSGKVRSPLLSLANRAALVITEDFPVPPFPAWVRSLAEKVVAPLWLVDTACIVPMQSVGSAFARAFEFRKALSARYDAALSKRYPAQPQIRDRPFNGQLGFESIDLAREDIAQLCADAAIDHSVGPAPGYVGGMKAAQARWSQFLANDLAYYDQRRNDADKHPEAVSRLSAYLHHGHISAFQLARDAWQHDSPGAQKFADELLIWRELAHNFCFHQDPGTLESVRSLPEWALATLTEHAWDARQVVYHDEQLALARTDNQLWNICQRGLLIHGELHNNLRMTWGKAIAGWTGSPDKALKTLIDLNHRYALDGGDPNSYGGLLWCLGLFDRPFKPEQPVYGLVRTRPLDGHAKRVSLPALATRASRYRGKPAPQVVVIGAGISGLTAARTLHDNGMSVRVLDRGRRPGGRVATSTDGFNYGAPGFEVSDPRFARLVAMLENQGVLRTQALTEARWRRPAGLARAETDRQNGTQTIGVPAMAALAKHLMHNLDLSSDTRVSTLHHDNQQWQVAGSGGELLAKADFLMIAMPLEQARRLGEAISDELTALSDRFSEPRWVTMLSYSQPANLAVDRIDFDGHPMLSRAICESGKPECDAGERWVVHSTAQWAQQNLETAREHVASQMAQAFARALGLSRPATVSRAHRWRYAQPAEPGVTGVIWNPEKRVAICGDWCSNGDVESAYLSGVAAAGRVLARDRALIQGC